MRVAHWSMINGSGMNNVAKTCVESERALGVDSVLIDTADQKQWPRSFDADVHVSHTMVPYEYNGKLFRDVLSKPFKMVGVFHGTPEHVFQGAVANATGGKYAPSDSLMIMFNNLKRCDALVTFWDRHKWIYDRMIGNGQTVHSIELGVDLEQWAGGASRGKFQGEPSLWQGDNPHYIKWPLDLFYCWPEVAERVPMSYLHVNYLASDLHRHFFPLVYANGANYRSHIGPWTYPHEELRNVFKSVDYLVNLVRYGDYNRLCIEARAANPKLKVISYHGNPYAHHWVTEGDQRRMTDELVAILSGSQAVRSDVRPPRAQSEMAKEMIAIYEQVLGRRVTNWDQGERFSKLPPEVLAALATPVGAGIEPQPIPEGDESTLLNGAGERSLELVT